MRRSILNGHSHGAIDISRMTVAEARATLLGAFDKASLSSRLYLVNVALTLNADDKAAPVAPVREIITKSTTPKLRLV
jgi:hypothetical protein